MTTEILVDDDGRLALIDAVIAMIEADDDPRKPQALADLKAQRAEVVARRGQQLSPEQPTSGPFDQVIQLRPLAFHNEVQGV